MRAWLHENSVPLSERDFFRDPFTETELRNLLGDTHVSDPFSYRSPSFKALDLSADTLDDSILIRLMLSEPRFIRRPIIKISERLIISPNQAALAAAFL